MNEEQKRIKALIDEQIQLLKDNPKLKGKSDAKLWAAEITSRSTKSKMADPEYRKDWDIAHAIGVTIRTQTPEWQEKQKLGSQKRSETLEWKKTHYDAIQELKNNEVWKENVSTANKLKAQDLEWKKTHYDAIQELKNNEVWKEKQKAGAELLLGKPVSANGTIYPSVSSAIKIIANDRNISLPSAENWFKRQVKNNNPLYFYVDKQGNKIEHSLSLSTPKSRAKPKVEVEPETVNSTYVTLEERKALAKMKREQDDITK